MNIGSHGGSCGHSCCLRIQDLSVKIAGDAVLRDVDLHVHCGEMVALIGPNGAGKSTLGVLLAKALGYDFIDTDILIQQKHKKLLQEIIDEDGIMRISAIPISKKSRDGFEELPSISSVWLSSSLSE